MCCHILGKTCRAGVNQAPEYWLIVRSSIRLREVEGERFNFLLRSFVGSEESYDAEDDVGSWGDVGLSWGAEPHGGDKLSSR